MSKNFRFVVCPLCKSEYVIVTLFESVGNKRIETYQCVTCDQVFKLEYEVYNPKIKKVKKE